MTTNLVLLSLAYFKREREKKMAFLHAGLLEHLQFHFMLSQLL